MDITSLLDSLSEEDMEKLRATAAQFLGGLPDASPEPDTPKPPAEEPYGMLSPDMLSAAAKIGAAFQRPDPRSDFIRALKPLLSPERGKKADEAVTLLKFINILNTLKGDGL